MSLFEFDTITIRLLQKITIIDTISVFPQTQQPSQLGHCATVPTVGADGEGAAAGRENWTVVVRCDNVSVEAPVSSAGVECGAFI